MCTSAYLREREIERQKEKETFHAKPRGSCAQETGGCWAGGGDGLGFPLARWVAANAGFNYFIYIALLPLIFKR